MDRVKEFPEFPVIETERLVLREITLDDAEWYLEHFSRKEVVEGQGFPAPESLEAAKKELETFIVGVFRERMGFRWGITLKGSRRLIGSLGFYRWVQPTGHMAEMGYDLQADHWSKGIMSEAMNAVIDFGFERMKLNRIEATAMPHNVRSRRLLERLGFKMEGVFRQRGFNEKGEPVDDIMFSMLRSDWEALRNKRS
jgi:ribosomal-protein-alanine N-acetyltransferase